MDEAPNAGSSEVACASETAAARAARGELRGRAEEGLRRMLGEGAAFREGQWEAVERLVTERGRLLLVQRTGWGKSLVYFLTTRLLRDEGAGPTLLVSPLLALMRNQLEMAERIGIRAATINSSNVGEWKAIEEGLREGRVDVLLISPERLGNPRFADNVLPAIGGRVGLFVVDEAHCISDWGHDFRPDYRRIVRILQRLPSNVPVLATTATANSRVVDDVLAQLGEGIVALRGSLRRTSLRLQAVELPDQDARLGWLAEQVPRLPGSGIIYCLTIPDVKRVAGFLNENGVNVKAYWGALEHERRLLAEADLRDNDVKALVATNALGMGYDKPDLGFVVHYQSPGSLVAYYQQVGRAGRAIDEAYGVMLVGEEDAEINNYFISSAFPRPAETEQVLGILEGAEAPLSRGMLAREVNMGAQRLEICLKLLEIEGAVARDGRRYFRTLNPYAPDAERERRVSVTRRRERERVLAYARSKTCLMQFLVGELDDEIGEPCGVCAVCAGNLFSPKSRRGTRADARDYLRRQAEPIYVRGRWPQSRDGSIREIPEGERLREGYALSLYGDSGWGARVARGKYGGEGFDKKLVRAAARFVAQRWEPRPAPTWVASVPSLARPRLVGEFARLLAWRLKLPYVEAIEKVRENRPQKEMENGYSQAANIWRAFRVREGVELPEGPVLLVDDIVDSNWTLTCIGVKLQRAGAGPVYPFALASAAKRS